MRINVEEMSDQEIEAFLEKVSKEQKDREMIRKQEDLVRIQNTLEPLRKKGWAVVAISPETLDQLNPRDIERELREFIFKLINSGTTM